MVCTDVFLLDIMAGEYEVWYALCLVETKFMKGINNIRGSLLLSAHSLYN